MYPLLIGFTFCFMASLISVEQTPPSWQEKYNVMRQDQIDSTDTLAIPLDSSNVEDEEELNRIENKNVYPLPKRR